MAGAKWSRRSPDLPGRSRALSRMSGRLVPARTTTPCVVAKPSISTSNWFSVFSRSSLPPAKPPRPRARPIASISSAHADGCVHQAHVIGMHHRRKQAHNSREPALQQGTALA